MILAGTATPHFADGRLAAWLSRTTPMAEHFQTLLTRDFDPAGVYISFDDSEAINGVLITLDIGGGQIDVWPPKADSDTIAEELLFHAVILWRARGATLFQSLIRETQDVRRSAMSNVGFRDVTTLVFYERTLTEADQALPPLTLQLRDAAFDDLAFAELLTRTYEGTADVPELNGLRTPAEILAGYQRSNKVDPPLWFYVTLQGADVGVLVLNLTDPREFELTYMGLVPAVRGRKLGRELGQIAVTLASGFGGTLLKLTADARNASADRVYSQLGFETVERRAVWLLI